MVRFLVGMEITFQTEHFSARVKLLPLEKKELMHVPKIKLLSKKSQEEVSYRQQMYDNENFPIYDYDEKKELTNSDGLNYKREEVYAIDERTGNRIDKVERTRYLELREQIPEKDKDDFVFDEYFEVVPSVDNQKVPLFFIAMLMKMKGPFITPIVIRAGYREKMAVVSVEFDEDESYFAILLRTTNSNLRLTRPTKVPKLPGG